MSNQPLSKYLIMIALSTLVALPISTPALKLKNIEIASREESTSIDLAFDKPFDYNITAIAGGLLIIIYKVNKVECSVPEITDNRFISSINIENVKKTLKVRINTTKLSKRFVSYKLSRGKLLRVEIKPSVDHIITSMFEKRYEDLRGIKCLIVDDDDGINNGNLAGGVDVDRYYTFYNENLDLGWDTITIMHNQKSIPLEKLAPYDLIIWITGINAVPETIGKEKLNTIDRYLKGGGKIVLISQNLFSDSPYETVAFFKDKLNIASVDYDTKISSVQYLPANNEEEEISLKSIISPAGNWGDGMILPDGGDSSGRAILKGADDRYYGITSKTAGIALFTVELANVDGPFKRLDILKSAIDYIMCE